MPVPEKTAKVLPLEALRGIAAIGLISHHFALGFLPHLVNYTHSVDEEGALIGSPLFMLVNGKAMVVLFFVISGYVLSFKGRRPDAPRLLGEAALKRLFRFAPTICLSVLFSYVLFALHLYRYDDVFALNGAGFFNHYADLPQTYQPHLSAVLQEGLWKSLFLGENSYNTVLWSMQPEFYGSMMVFALALLLAPARRWWLGVALPLMGILLFNESIWTFPFLFGVLGARLELEKIALGRKMTVLALVAGIYLSGYYRAVGWYSWGALIDLPLFNLRVLVTALGGFLLLTVFATQNSVSRRFNGPVSKMLGKISFSIYLMHTLVLASFCAWAYVRVGGATAGVIAAAVTFLLTAPPLIFIVAWFDQWWLTVLRRWHPIRIQSETSNV